MRNAIALLLLVPLGACAAGGRAGLEGRPQQRALSCESRSACDLLAFHGVRVEEAAFLARLPRSDNPDLGFVGDPDDEPGGLPPAGYGVHAPPVADTLRSFGADARAVRGRDLAWLRSEVEAGRPVIVWATADLRPAEVRALVDARGRAFRAVRWEHVFLVVGARRGSLVLLDPAHGEERTVDEARFDAAWALFDRAAVSCAPPLTPGEPRRRE